MSYWWSSPNVYIGFPGVRIAAILDGDEEAVAELARTLWNNGYIVHVFMRGKSGGGNRREREGREGGNGGGGSNGGDRDEAGGEEDSDRRRAQRLANRSFAYVHLFRDVDDLRAKIARLKIEDVEVAIAMSTDHELNRAFIEVMKGEGVPRAILVIRGNGERGIRRFAEEYGVEIVEIDSCVVSRIASVLDLRFSRVLRIRGNVAVCEIKVTADSRLVGKDVKDLAEKYGVALVVSRDGEVIREGEIQEGDVVVAVGDYESVERLASE